MTSVSSRSLSLMSLPSLNISLANNNNDTSMMHQDNHRLLHNHSIQHISQSTSDIISCMSPKDVCVSSPISRYGDSEDSPKINQQSDAFSDLDRNDMRKINNCVMDDLSDARSSSVSSYQADSFHREPDDDRISCCSDDSELSVGKEVDENEQAQEIMLPARTNHNTRTKKHSLIEDAIDDSNDNSIADRSNLMCASEEASNESSKYTTLTPNSSRDESVRFPIARPSPTRLQEEFLRNSQLYAEELMKHQMSFMAVTKGLNICSKINDHTFGFPVRPDLVSPMKSDEQPKIGFRPLVRTTTMEKDQRWQTSIDDRSSPQSPEGINFRGIHSHLNAISKITSALGRGDMINLMSPGSMTSRESSQSPPNNIQQMILHNNIMHDSNLKFSIDNILKPGFGRRITDPLLKRNKTNKKQRLNQEKKLHEKNGTPIDLTATTTTTMTTATTPTPSSSAAETPPPNSNEQDKMTSTSNSTSKSPMVWPAWVYCTRYSDRPSSGPRTRRPKKPPSEKGSCSSDEKRPRTAFSGPQLARLKHEFAENRYLTERRRQQLSSELGLNEAQIKIWFQNKRAKIKKSSGHKNPLALQLMAQGLYNHSTVPLTREEEELQELQAQAKVGP